MAEFEHTLQNGVWQILLPAEEAALGLIVRCAGEEIPFEEEPQEGGMLRLHVPLPPLSAGVQVLTLDVAGGAPLLSLPIKAGSAALEETERELALLRAELDLVKRFLRQVLLNPM